MTEEATPGRTDASRRIPSGGRLRERVVAADERAGRLAGRPDVEPVTVHADCDEDTVVGPASRRRQPDRRQALDRRGSNRPDGDQGHQDGQAGPQSRGQRRRVMRLWGGRLVYDEVASE